MEPRLVEFIKSLSRPGGGRLGEEGSYQMRVLNWPPGLTRFSRVSPSPAWYAALSYRLMFGADMVPDAFTGEIANAGRVPMSGTITRRALEEGLWGFQLITITEPLIVSASNVSGLVQLFELLIRYIIIPSAEDLGLIRKHMEDLALSGWQEYREEALSLLRRMAPLGRR